MQCQQLAVCMQCQQVELVCIHCIHKVYAKLDTVKLAYILHTVKYLITNNKKLKNRVCMQNSQEIASRAITYATALHCILAITNILLFLDIEIDCIH